MSILVELVATIETDSIFKKLSHPESGGICVFVGSVRNQTKLQEVTSLDFEAYESMALKEMQEIAETAKKRWSLNKVIINHVTGEKKVEEPVVVVGASSAHRDACFEACRYLIDTLKDRVPIWKKEVFKDKSVWVSAHP